MSKDEKPKKKPGFMKRLFSSKKMSIEDDVSDDKQNRRLQRMNTVADPANLSREEEQTKEKSSEKTVSKDDSAAAPVKNKTSSDSSKKDAARAKTNGDVAKPRKPKPKKDTGSGAKRRKRKKDKEVKVDISKELSFPCTPEVVLEHHKHKPFLNSSEEWLMVELNEFECLVDSMKIIKIVAKHSKFFEVEPDELWEEFFEWVDDCPAYDEVINYDIWQEFRDKKYPM